MILEVVEKHGQVDLGEVNLHWTEAGQGPPVLLLHGLNDSHRTWREIWPRIPGRRVLMLDLPGHGMSSRPSAPYTLDWNATQVARWIEQLDLNDLDVAGHSYGGGVAMAALEMPPPDPTPGAAVVRRPGTGGRSEEHTSELQS